MNVRLSPDQIKDISSVVKDKINFKYDLYLFGSRTDVSKRGGDIDLLIVVAEDKFDEALSLRFRLMDRIMSKKSIDEMRTDISVCVQKDLEVDPFFSTLINKVKIS